VYGKPTSSATYRETFEPPMEIIKKKKKAAKQKMINVWQNYY
jgi:ribosomal protein S21